MWNYTDKDYSMYYGKQLVVYFRSKKDAPLQIVSGKLNTITQPYHDICLSEVAISISDCNNHVIIICSNLIENIYLDISDRTKNAFNIIKPLILKKTNRDILFHISLFLTHDYIELQ